MQLARKQVLGRKRLEASYWHCAGYKSQSHLYIYIDMYMSIHIYIHMAHEYVYELKDSDRDLLGPQGSHGGESR